MRSNKLIQFRLDKYNWSREEKIFFQKFVDVCLMKSSYDPKTNTYWIEIKTLKKIMGGGLINARFSPQNKNGS